MHMYDKTMYSTCTISMYTLTNLRSLKWKNKSSFWRYISRARDRVRLFGDRLSVCLFDLCVHAVCLYSRTSNRCGEISKDIINKKKTMKTCAYYLSNKCDKYVHVKPKSEKKLENLKKSSNKLFCLFVNWLIWTRCDVFCFRSCYSSGRVSHPIIYCY